MDREAIIAGCVTMLAETFGKKVSPAMFKAYQLGLRDLTDEQIAEAATKAVSACRFMPPPVELREMVLVKTEDRAVKAWLAFERAVVSHGYIRSVTFDDPIINGVVRALGGWEHCCGMPANEFDKFLQKRFQETYCALARAGVSEDQAAPLVGWIDRENGVLGYDQESPHLVATGIPSLPNAVRITQAKYSRPVDLPNLELKQA